MNAYPVVRPFQGRQGFLGQGRLATPWSSARAIVWWDTYGSFVGQNPQCANALSDKIGTFANSVRSGRLSPGDTLFLAPEDLPLERDLFLCMGLNADGTLPAPPASPAPRPETSLLIGVGVIAAAGILWKLSGL